MAARQNGDAVADVRRDQMLAAAATLIAERGFHDTRIADVAKRVGASPALVIYYFGTKDSLLTEALRWSERSFYAATEEMLGSTEGLRDRLETLIEWTLTADAPEALTTDWGLWFDLWAQAFRHPEVKKDRAELDAQWRHLIARIVQEGVDRGEIDDLEVTEFAIMWGSLLDGLVVQVSLDDPVVNYPLARRIALSVAEKELGLAPRRTRAKAAGKRPKNGTSAKNDTGAKAGTSLRSS
jgi:AcrR family transcriptional regulator